jgi:hypothetical protein
MEQQYAAMVHAQQNVLETIDIMGIGAASFMQPPLTLFMTVVQRVTTRAQISMAIVMEIGAMAVKP